VLNATYSNRLVRGHVRQDQLGAASSTTHHTHRNADTSSAHPLLGIIDIGHAMPW
jgi:hypothetical protein